MSVLVLFVIATVVGRRSVHYKQITERTKTVSGAIFATAVTNGYDVADATLGNGHRAPAPADGFRSRRTDGDFVPPDRARDSAEPHPPTGTANISARRSRSAATLL
ncbi:Hypothetical protein CINCED_3A018819 [Cinara cedri]|uniref:Secreted protein n=1 Tax=Cinara cedri TaxID=506608 RepID=A0A5E4MWG2_9HEMI|nr:Hypothetical protein CINCED_3A018819 [Cinara cedri]